MFQRFSSRIAAPLVLLLIGATLTLPNLGRPSLWDIDEGNNAEAAREMLMSGNWIVPTFNYQLRPDKPALLYWLQMAGYQLFGINEFSARLPSALAALLTILVSYQLGSIMFGPGAGFSAGLVLASTVSFCASAHFANPDALLSCFSTLTLLLFWRSLHHDDRLLFIGAGASTGLAVLAKGPVGLVLPITIMGLFLLWSRRLRWLLNRKLAWSVASFLLVAAPWYAWVAADTRGDFLRLFILRHNTGRFLQTLEGHAGPPFYYLLVLILGFAPWSAFLGLAAWCALRRDAALETSPDVGNVRDANRFLCCWIVVYIAFFTAAATKLPNYILPLYPAMAIATGRFLESWRRAAFAPPRWAMAMSLGSLFLIGLGAGVGLMIAGGAIGWPSLKVQRLPGVEAGVYLMIGPLAGTVVAIVLFCRRQARAVVACVGVTAVLFIGSMAAWGSTLVDPYKATRELAAAFHAAELPEETRVASYLYDQPSLVFYCQREVQRLPNDEQMLEFVRYPIPVYLFVPAPTWESLKPKVRGPHRMLARHYDFYRHCDVLLVTNR
jgi:4-amino-4-deoxy-L-arabinose transferase-like glycosyltransferase